jgi:hypothetical protein
VKTEDKRPFVVALTALASVKQRDLERHVIEAYWEDLEPYDLEDVLAALKRCRQEITFFPQAPDIIERARAIRERRRIENPALPPAPMTAEEQAEADRARARFRALVDDLVAKFTGGPK